MMAIPTTTISIYRGTYTTPAGDVQDSTTPLYTGVPASIMERNRLGIDSTTQTPIQIRFIVGRVASDQDIQVNDRVQDETTGLYYAVADIGNLSSPVHIPDLRLDLKRLT